VKTEVPHFSKITLSTYKLYGVKTGYTAIWCFHSSIPMPTCFQGSHLELAVAVKLPAIQLLQFLQRQSYASFILMKTLFKIWYKCTVLKSGLRIVWLIFLVSHILQQSLACFLLQFLDIHKCLIPHRCDITAKGRVLDHVYKFKEMLLFYVNEGNSNFCEYFSSELWCTKLPFHGCLSIRIVSTMAHKGKVKMSQ